MSKERARGPQSYLDEQLVLAMIPELLRAKGFEAVRVEKRRGRKFLVADPADGDPVVFWLKQGWSNTRLYSAIQFGMIAERRDPASQADSVFVDHVARQAAGAESRGATHVLMVHMHRSSIRNYVALRVEDLVSAYRRQMQGWPKRARNTKMPTLYFEDGRDLRDVGLVEAVTDLEIPLEDLAGAPAEVPASASEAGSRKITAEVERRLKQQVFRVRVGERYGWTCALSGTSVREVLEAAHLPGRDWRVANAAADGVLLRADLHRLLDRGIAEIRGDRFTIIHAARAGEYMEYDGALITP
jgi:hypothetical protein